MLDKLAPSCNVGLHAGIRARAHFSHQPLSLRDHPGESRQEMFDHVFPLCAAVASKYSRQIDLDPLTPTRFIHHSLQNIRGHRTRAPFVVCQHAMRNAELLGKYLLAHAKPPPNGTHACTDARGSARHSHAGLHAASSSGVSCALMEFPSRSQSALTPNARHE